MSERAAYSRVYWSVMEDPKFDGVRENVRHFGAWSMMLIIADMAWPAPAYVPPTIPKSCLRALIDATLVDPLTGGRFRIHGLEAERTRRREAATRPPTHRPPPAPQLGPKRDPVAAQDEDKTRTRQDETRDNAGDRDSLDTYHELTLYRPWGVFSGDKLKVAIDDYGDPDVDAALREEATINADRKTLLDRTLARLARNADRQRDQRKAKPRIVRPTDAERSQALRNVRAEAKLA